MSTKQLKQRVAEKLAEKEKFFESLKERKFVTEKITKLDPKKLMDYVSVNYEDLIINRHKNIKFKSHNLSKQWIEFLEHTFCNYKVPRFMLVNFPYDFTYVPKDKNQIKGSIQNLVRPYPKIIRADYNSFDRNNIPIYQEMFQLITNGGSLRKYLKGLLTAKECAIFLTLKNELSITENIWLSKLIGFGFNTAEAIDLINTFFIVFDPFFNYLDDVYIMQFFMKFKKEIPRDEYINLTDFLRLKYRENNRLRENNFSLKGRTIQSVIEMSNQWHLEQLKLRGGKNVNWVRIELEDRKIERNGVEYKFVELTSSNELIAEGRKQRHCVGSYIRQCLDGNTSIFSMRYKDDKYDEIRVTLQIEHNIIKQARGLCNRKITGVEDLVIREWARDRYQISRL